MRRSTLALCLVAISFASLPDRSPNAQTDPQPLPEVKKGLSVDWWFVFKLNAEAFPGCGGGATQHCLFDSHQPKPQKFGQKFIYATSDAAALREGGGCVGDSLTDPVGATFDEIYNGHFNYVVWNDQFIGHPLADGSTGTGHSKGLLAWNNAGDGMVMQVTTPDWPGSGSSDHPRQGDGNSLGYLTRNNVAFSQHFFSLKLSKSDVVTVLKALQTASVVTDPHNVSIVKNGGPSDIRNLVSDLGTKSDSMTPTLETLSSGVEVISKPAKLHAPPWQLVSSLLGAIRLRAATWVTAEHAIPSTTTSTDVSCLPASFARPGAVEVVDKGHWLQSGFNLLSGPASNGSGNHAKIGVSIEAGEPTRAIFGDMNQEGALSGGCEHAQNVRGGLFFVLRNETLARGLNHLLTKTPN